MVLYSFKGLSSDRNSTKNNNRLNDIVCVLYLYKQQCQRNVCEYGEKNKKKQNTNTNGLANYIKRSVLFYLVTCVSSKKGKHVIGVGKCLGLFHSKKERTLCYIGIRVSWSVSTMFPGLFTIIS